MTLDYLGQYWNARTRQVHLLGKGQGVVHDLTPHLPYASLRAAVRERLAGAPGVALLLEHTPFPTVQAIVQAEAAGQRLSELLEPVWARAQTAGEPLDENALDIAPRPEASHLLACIIPLRAQAFGVTYENSALEREAEGRKADYRYVYLSGKRRGERAEIFIKGTRPSHFYGPNGNMGLRSDLTNSEDVAGRSKPRETVLAGIEPELAAVTYSDGRILGYTLANDTSGNNLENESLLYLFQAKYFAACMGIGPWLWLSDEQDNPGITFGVDIRDDVGRHMFRADADSRLIGLPLHALVAQAASHNPLYPGELFSTGTNIVPGAEAKVLRPGWRVEIRSDVLGRFRHGAALVRAGAGANLDYTALELER
ncbi:MAG: fumarylacetoacetate hydrolase family protein [Candidatus Lambdaproteobacteria bacterium]|nr:fumarylacetoacetate hydrolase family protein [Candidatus Lambdaproteobacteria bacterium]